MEELSGCVERAGQLDLWYFETLLRFSGPEGATARQGVSTRATCTMCGWTVILRHAKMLLINSDKCVHDTL